MDDQFMYGMRGEPGADFSRRLEARLEQSAALDESPVGRGKVARTAGWIATAAVSVLALSLPSVQVAAKSFLDWFRVTNFAAAPFDSSRLQALDVQQGKLGALLGGQIQVLKEPGEPVRYSTVAEANAVLGTALKVPTWTPAGWTASHVMVTGASSARMVVDASKLRELLQTLGIDDLQISDALDGAALQADMEPVASMVYAPASEPGTSATGASAANASQPAREAAQRRVMLIQSRSPAITVPAGVELAQLGEIGLRILGLERTDAYRIAQSVDWRTTMLVPVPIDAASFREIDVQGQGGLLIQQRHPRNQDRLGNALLLWSVGDRVYALSGNVPVSMLVSIAQSIA